MPKISQWKSDISSGRLDAQFTRLYQDERAARRRYENLLDLVYLAEGDAQAVLVSAPGRAEIIGNHTDHNGGMVLAAAVNMDIATVAARNDKNKIHIISHGYDEITIDISDLSQRSDEKNTSAAILRGMARAMSDEGMKIAGCTIAMHSHVPNGSGLSSSAAFEVATGAALRALFGHCGIVCSDEKLAVFSKYAENEYFGKPSGLMDQTASAVGGLVFIDFKDAENARVEKLDYDFSKTHMDIIVVNVGDSHDNLTHAYAAIPDEMRSVAQALGCAELRQTTRCDLMNNIPAIRRAAGDRAILRALHFFDENARVASAVESIKNGDINAFMAAIASSGDSSWKLLQNIYFSHENQGLALALAITQSMDLGGGASRVHGGGFAGTILTFINSCFTQDYIAKMDEVFGNGACTKLSVRPVGAYEFE